MRDSRRWITSFDHGFAIIRADSPHTWRVIRFRDKDFALMQTGLIGEACDGSILTGSALGSIATRQATLTRFRLDARRVVFHNVRVPLPFAGIPLGVVLSPNGDKLAWLIQGNSYTTLWISSATGNFSNLAAPVELPAVLKPDSLRWLPDGKHLSFLSGETLYKVTLP